MPKPYFLARPSGLYVRFLVPQDLREIVGSRFLLRSLGPARGDRARFVAAALAVALSEAFARMRTGAAMVDVKKLLESAQNAAQSGTGRDWTATNVRVGGVDFGTVSTSGPEDTQDFIRALEAAAAMGPVPASPQADSADPPAPMLSEEIGHHIADLERRKLAPDTITESRHSLRILLGVVGDRPVSEIKREQIRAFWDAVRWWPANATVKPKYRGLTVAEIVERGRSEHVPPPSDHTTNKHRQRLGVFFNALVDADVIAKSPLRGTGGEIETSTDANTGRAFTDSELRQIFDPANFLPWAETPHRFWGPILGLYTGARVNEIAQLYLEDVREIAGVWGLFFRKNARSQKIKTKSSIRFVPIAQPVLDAGFLTFIEDMKATGHSRLFPHLPAGTSKSGEPNGMGYGRQLSRQFAAYTKRFGIEQGVAFHAFRHTLSTKLAEAMVPVKTIAMITGHATKQEVAVLEAHYIHVADVSTLPERVEALQRFAPSIGLAKYRALQFAECLGDKDSLHP